LNKIKNKLRVGVTIHLRQDQQSIWENGIFQNCAFLVQLLKRSPIVKKAVLVNGGDATVIPNAMMLGGTGISVIGLTEALQNLDVIIEMSAQLPEEWISEFRKRGGKTAWMRVGNDYVIDIERAIFNKPSASLISSKKFDAIWTLPQYKNITDYFTLTMRAPVKILPHIWTPYFLELGCASIPKHLKFGYEPGKKRWRVCCFEANICMVKTSFIPMLAVEEAYRSNPEFLEHFYVLNTLHLKNNAVFVHYARNLDIVNHALASFEGRYATYEYMANFGDCIVSHQWENSQNYLYYEALYGGYPLIHNSPIIKDLGYYYPDFDTGLGGAAIIRAFTEHDKNINQYNKEARKFLYSLDVTNPENIKVYTDELLLLFKDK
jgi:hypothetical protein